MSRRDRLANETWEALLRATSTTGRRLSAGDVWTELSRFEYDVLYTLKKNPEGVRITDLGERIMITQTGLTRLAARLVHKNFVRRIPDEIDKRATRLVLTEQGEAVQRRVGIRHAREVTDAMTDHLSADELAELKRLCLKMLPHPKPPPQALPSAESAGVEWRT